MGPCSARKREGLTDQTGVARYPQAQARLFLRSEKCCLAILVVGGRDERIIRIWRTFEADREEGSAAYDSVRPRCSMKAPSAPALHRSA